MLWASDEELQAFRDGDPKAEERVYWAYVRRVDRQIRALLRRFNSSELQQASAIADLVQEVFVKAFSDGARAAYDGQRDYGPYLAAIARNCVIDALRRRGREVPTEPTVLASSELADEETGQRYDPTVLAILRSYLSELPQALHDVYRHRFVLGQSQQQACGELGLSRRTLRTREEHLRKGLRKALMAAGSFTVKAVGPTATIPFRAESS